MRWQWSARLQKHQIGEIQRELHEWRYDLIQHDVIKGNLFHHLRVLCRIPKTHAAHESLRFHVPQLGRKTLYSGSHHDGPATHVGLSVICGSCALGALVLKTGEKEIINWHIHAALKLNSLLH